MVDRFVLGVGAQKAGTTWVHQYLRNDAKFKPGLKKEYHIWNRRYLDLFRSDRRSIWRVRRRHGFKLWLMERLEWYYFEHFRVLLNGKAEIVADITPDYAGLNETVLRRIKEGMARRGIATRCLFLVRDPVARCISGFAWDRKGIKPGQVFEAVVGDGPVEEGFRRYFASDYAQLRTKYGATLERLTRVFDREEIMVIFYEDMFEPANIRTLSEFLGVEYRPQEAQAEVNRATSKFTISDAAQADCARFYAETYAYMARAFPQATKLWEGYGRLA